MFSAKPEHTNLSVNVDIAKRVPFGISIELTCTTHAHPAADGFKFYRDEDLLGSNSTGLYNLKLERSAVYSCVPFNSIGDGERATLQINVMGNLRYSLFERKIVKGLCKMPG